ncbi:hypothetical protein MASR1M74_13870 [Lentimicrobium sp.]
MNVKIIALILTGVIALAACTSQLEKDTKRIDALEKQIDASGGSPDQAKLDELLSEYDNYVNKYPDDTLAPDYLYKSITLSMFMNDGDKALAYTDRMINNYPQNRYMPEVIFLKGFIYENLLNNYGQALKYYQEFIKMFPGHDLADDAEAAITHLGKSPEEIVREFEQKEAEAAGR